jgi:hypothetical protein
MYIHICIYPISYPNTHDEIVIKYRTILTARQVLPLFPEIVALRGLKPSKSLVMSIKANGLFSTKGVTLKIIRDKNDNKHFCLILCYYAVVVEIVRIGRRFIISFIFIFLKFKFLRRLATVQDTVIMWCRLLLYSLPKM